MSGLRSPARAFAYLDAPLEGRDFAGEYVCLDGWCFFEDSPLTGFLATWQSLELPICSQLDGARPDVFQMFRNQHAAHSGFRTHFFTYSIPEVEFPVTLSACALDGMTQPVAVIQLMRTELHQARRLRSRRNKLFPIGIAGAGRSGTTLLMRYFDAHPQIVTHRDYPFERSLINLDVHRFHELTLPVAHNRVRYPDRDFATHEKRNDPQAFPEKFGIDSIEGKWLLALQSNTAAYLRKCTEDHYKRIASAHHKRAAAFAEKLSRFDHQYLEFLKIYDRGRLVILVRDPRDRFISQRDFDRKRGFDGGWYIDSDGTLGGFLKKLKQELWMNALLLRRFPDRVFAVQYEDLVQHPETTLAELLCKLSLSCNRPLIERMKADVERSDRQYTDHRTSAEPQKSISRWKMELDPELAAAFSAVLGGELSAFGYEMDPNAGQPSEALLQSRLIYTAETRGSEP
jgi:Sulfotransferase family